LEAQRQKREERERCHSVKKSTAPKKHPKTELSRKEQDARQTQTTAPKPAWKGGELQDKQKKTRRKCQNGNRAIGFGLCEQRKGEETIGDLTRLARERPTGRATERDRYQKEEIRNRQCRLKADQKEKSRNEKRGLCPGD